MDENNSSSIEFKNESSLEYTKTNGENGEYHQPFESISVGTIKEKSSTKATKKQYKKAVAALLTVTTIIGASGKIGGNISQVTSNKSPSYSLYIYYGRDDLDFSLEGSYHTSDTVDNYLILDDLGEIVQQKKEYPIENGMILLDDGFSYSTETNTIYLNNYKNNIDLQCVGTIQVDSLTIHVTGQCQIGTLYAGRVFEANSSKLFQFHQLNLEGDGTLIIGNAFQTTPFQFLVEDSPSLMTIGEDLQLEIRGKEEYRKYEYDERGEKYLVESMDYACIGCGEGMVGRELKVQVLGNNALQVGEYDSFGNIVGVKQEGMDYSLIKFSPD